MVTDEEAFPLTEIQYAYWIGRGDRFVLGNVAPHAYFELTGRRLDPGRLEVAWRILVQRHEMLRAVVRPDGHQHVLPQVPDYVIRFDDLGEAGGTRVAEHLERTRSEMSQRVYDASSWPLFEIRLTRLPEHDRLHISLDLLMVDLASVGVLFGEWAQLCLDPGLALKPLEVSFRDYVLALEDSRSSPRHQRALDYWTDRAPTLPDGPGLPLAKPPGDVARPVFTHREFRLPPPDWDRFQRFARQRAVTPTAALAAAFAATLARWGEQERFCLNLTLFNRLPLLHATLESGHKVVHPDLSGLVGDFTSIVLLEVDTAAAGNFAELVGQVKQQLRRDLQHREVSGLHALRERRRRGLQFGFDAIPVVFTSGLGSVSRLPEAREYFGEIGYRISQTPQIYLDHQVLDASGWLELSWDTVEELFPPSYLDDAFAAYCDLVCRLAREEPQWDRPVTQALSEPDRVDRQAANSVVARRSSAPLHAGLRGGDLPAIMAAPARDWTHGEVERASAHLAHLLAENRGTVAIVLEKSAEQIVAALAASRAGCAYVPVDADLPQSRRDLMIRSTGPSAVVTTSALRAELDLPPGVRCVAIDEPAFDERAIGLSDVDGQPSPDDLAYIIYTSGSTGVPKGVMVSHGAARNTIDDINRRFAVGPADAVLSLTALSFDLSVYDIFGVLCAGGTVVLPQPHELADPAAWARHMRRGPVTIWNSVPAQMEMLVEHLEATGDAPPGLRLVLLSGDWIPVTLPARVKRLWPRARVVSLGGATEAAVWSILHEIGDLPPGARSVPYGKPLANQRFHVLDRRMLPRPRWVPGELYIGGDGLALGYHGDARRTEESFITHPSTGERLYRTGDFGRYLPGGEIEFLGRRDGQIKINGYRIELGEIEAALAEHPGVEQAVAVKVTGDSGAARIAAFVTTSSPPPPELSTVDTADPAVSKDRWEALSRTATRPAPAGPTHEGVTRLWRALDRLHACAVTVAFETGATKGAAPRYERWLTRARAVAGAEAPMSRVPRAVLDEARRTLMEVLGLPEDVVEPFLAMCADGLGAVLREEVHSAQLYTSEVTPQVYDKLFGACYAVATDAVRRLLEGWTGAIRVLEVGAGLGTLTRHLLALFPPERTGYLFTDISAYFLNRARESFAGYGFVRYGRFDIDDPVGDERFDLIVAASVLHDARDVARAVAGLRSRLSAGGSLLIVEQTSFAPWFDLLMGLQQGFDGFTDTRLRGTHALLKRAQWAALLREAGFARVEVLGTGPGWSSVGFDVIVAQNAARVARVDTGRLVAHLAQRLPGYMVPAVVRELPEIPLTRNGKVDRGRLAGIVAGAESVVRHSTREPATDLERLVLDVWREVLAVADLGVDEGFLEAGGDSLLATRLSARLGERLGKPLALAAIFEHPTVARLTDYLQREGFGG